MKIYYDYGHNRKFNSNNNYVRPGIIITDYKKFYEGMIYTSFYGTPIKIIEYIDNRNVVVEFLDDTHYITTTFMSCVKDGNVKNPYKRTVYGGYFGEGPYNTRDHSKAYKTWDSMLKRANAYLDKPSYYNCSVCEEWLNFQNFAQWYCSYISLLNSDYYHDYQLDKDILQWNFPKKIYSPESCCLVPQRVNSALVGLNMKKTNNLPLGVSYNGYGSYIASIDYNEQRIHLGTFSTPEEAFKVYRKAKISAIRDVADYYYKDGAILKDIYDRLYNIEILP